MAAADTIGNWTEDTLSRYVREAIRLLTPDHQTSLTVDDLRVAGTLLVSGSATFTLGNTFFVFGRDGTPQYGNGWTNAGSPYFDAAFTKTSDGWVRLRGAIKSGTVGAGAVNLPPGYRPASTSRHAVVSNGAFGIVDVLSDGDIVPQSPSSNALVSLDGITFKAA